MTRRTLLKRVALGVGALFASVAALAVVDADHADTGQPVFTRALGADGPQLVLLPGIGATTRYWEIVVGALAKRVRMLLVDLLGVDVDNVGGDVSLRPDCRYSTTACDAGHTLSGW